MEVSFSASANDNFSFHCLYLTMQQLSCHNNSFKNELKKKKRKNKQKQRKIKIKTKF